MIFNANKQITLEDQGVHEMPCEDCEKNLIGQTNGQIQIWKEEHRNTVNIDELFIGTTYKEYWVCSGL